MNRLWTYKDYVKYLSHKNSLVRCWAFEALTTQYATKYCNEISRFIKDENNYLACKAVKYLAEHNAVEHAPEILEIFKKSEGKLPLNCAIALAKMKYEPALEDVIGSLSNNLNSGALFGIFEYLGKIQNKNSRETLISAATQIKDPFLKGFALLNLLRHGNAENAEKIIKTVMESIKKDNFALEIELQTLMGFWAADLYFDNITEYSGQKDIIENPGECLEKFFKINSHISISKDSFDTMVKHINRAKYHDLVISLMFEIQNIVKQRYADKEGFKEVEELFFQDILAVELLKELARNHSLWRDLKKEGYSNLDILIAFVISLYCSVLERDVYVRVLASDAGLKELLLTVKKAGAGLPESIYRKMEAFAPVSELKNALSEKLDTWGDIWIVRIMGQIGRKEFLPDLIKVLNNTEVLDFIYADSFKSIRALCESAGETVLKAVQDSEIKDCDMLTVLENLHFSESFDLVSLRWDDEENRKDLYESAARCLSAIGDKRGIKKLQEIYAAGFQESYIGDSLECLATLHNVPIPELNDIYKRREEAKKQKTKADEFDQMVSDIGNIRNIGNIGNQNNIIPFKRENPKVGRNEPCSCGSGKKYKKCCLNKI